MLLDRLVYRETPRFSAALVWHRCNTSQGWAKRLNTTTPQTGHGAEMLNTTQKHSASTHEPTYANSWEMQLLLVSTSACPIQVGSPLTAACNPAGLGRQHTAQQYK